MPADAIAIFDLKQDGSTRPAKKQKVTLKRPEHISRELFELYGERAPPVVVQEAQRLKPKPKIPYPAAQWEISAFTNPARTDGLVLKHWRKKPARATALGPATPADLEAISAEKPGRELSGTQQTKSSGTVETDYPFAKYNIKVATPKYSDEEYQQHLEDPHWSKEETDYLIELALEFDLRWIVIADRYDFSRGGSPDGSTVQVNGGHAPSVTKEKDSTTEQDVAMGNSDVPRPLDSSIMSHPDPHLRQVRDALVVQEPPPRTMEEMKSRYYTIAAKIMALHTPLTTMSSTEFELHEKMTKFNPDSEAQRKDIASKLLARDPLEIQEEELLLTELKRIVQNEDKLIQERKELYERLEAPPSSGNIAMYQSNQGLQQLFNQLVVADRNKKRRSLTGPNEINSGPATAPQTGDSRHPASSMADRTQRGSQPNSAITKRPASGLNPSLKRLSRAEEARFGIQHHERITSGVTFRTARIDKLVTAKSTSQSQKLAAALTELGIPTRLFMPTAKVCAEFERLIGHIQTLLDVRKMSEKSEGECRVLKQMKEDLLNGESTAEGSGIAQGDGQHEDGESKLDEGDTKMTGLDVEDDDKDEDEDKDNASAAEPEEDADNDDSGKRSEDDEDAEAEIDDDQEEDHDQEEEEDGEEGETQDLDIEEEDAANSDLGDDASEGDIREGDGQSEEEEDDSEGEDAKSKASVALSTRSSRARTKRSASLMSSTSRQSSKRQRK